MALRTCTGLREVLDARWEQLRTRPPPFRNPSQDELTRDTQLSLSHSGEYIRNALANPDPQLPGTPSHPSHRRRGTIENFLSSNGTFFDEAYDADPNITLYDVERSVEEGIDDRLVCVTNVDEACVQLETLMDKYMKVCELKVRNPQDISIRLLTAIELYVALDKLVVKEIPMLADYPPEIPIACLGKLLLRKTASIVYLRIPVPLCVQFPSTFGMVGAFKQDSFPVRYNDQSSHLRRRKDRWTGQPAAGRCKFLVHA